MISGVRRFKLIRNSKGRIVCITTLHNSARSYDPTPLNLRQTALLVLRKPHPLWLPNMLSRPPNFLAVATSDCLVVELRLALYLELDAWVEGLSQTLNPKP